MTISICSTGARRYTPPPAVDQTLQSFRLVTVAKIPEVSLADAERLRRLPAAQTPGTTALQPVHISRHPYLGLHLDPRVWQPSKTRQIVSC
jgi:hypothetical protein